MFMLMATKNVLVQGKPLLAGEFVKTPTGRIKKFRTYENATKYARELYEHGWTKVFSVESEWWNSPIA